MVHRPTGVSWGDPWGKPRGYPGGSPRISAGYPPGVLPEVPSGGPPWGTHGIAPVVRLVLTRHQYVWFIVFFTNYAIRLALTIRQNVWSRCFAFWCLLGFSWGLLEISPKVNPGGSPLWIFLGVPTGVTLGIPPGACLGGILQADLSGGFL